MKSNRTIRLLLSYLIKGALLVIPLAGALFLLVWIVTSIDSAINLSAWLWPDNPERTLDFPGLGILTLLVGLVIIGMFFTYFVTEPTYNWFIRLLNKIPLFNTFYSSIKDITEAFVGDTKKFSEPVIVLVNETGLKKVGFLTQKDLQKIGLPDDVVVYFPYAYSFAGQVVITRAENVKPLNISATDAMKLVVSGGVSGLE